MFLTELFPSCRHGDVLLKCHVRACTLIIPAASRGKGWLPAMTRLTRQNNSIRPHRRTRHGMCGSIARAPRIDAGYSAHPAEMQAAMQLQRLEAAAAGDA